MFITVNGKGVEVGAHSTVETLLNQLELPADRTVVEVGGRIVIREEHSSTLLGEGDLIELIRFVGGG